MDNIEQPADVAERAKRVAAAKRHRATHNAKVRALAKQSAQGRADAVMHKTSAAMVLRRPVEVPPGALTQRAPVAQAVEVPPNMAVDLLNRMLGELDAITANIGQIEAEIRAETESDIGSSRRVAMLRAVSLPIRADTLKKLMMAQATVSPDGDVLKKSGKKAQQDDAARTASFGKFAPGPPPLRVVAGGD